MKSIAESTAKLLMEELCKRLDAIVDVIKLKSDIKNVEIHTKDVGKWDKDGVFARKCMYSIDLKADSLEFKINHEYMEYFAPHTAPEYSQEMRILEKCSEYVNLLQSMGKNVTINDKPIVDTLRKISDYKRKHKEDVDRFYREGGNIVCGCA